MPSVLVLLLSVVGIATTSAFTTTPALALRGNALPRVNQAPRHATLALCMQEVNETENKCLVTDSKG